MKEAIAATIAALSISSSHAEWAREPEYVLGIHLGRPISEATLPPCPQSEWLARYPNIKETCLWHGMGKPPNLIHGIAKPPIDEIKDMAVSTNDGIAERIFGTFASRDFSQILDVFVARYGEPTSNTIRTVTSPLSGPIESRTTKWEGRQIILEINEHGSSVTKGRFSFFTRESETSALEKRRKEVEKAASQF